MSAYSSIRQTEQTEQNRQIRPDRVVGYVLCPSQGKGRTDRLILLAATRGP
jgi:hypothetical protein